MTRLIPWGVPSSRSLRRWETTNLLPPPSRTSHAEYAPTPGAGSHPIRTLIAKRIQSRKPQRQSLPHPHLQIISPSRRMMDLCQAELGSTRSPNPEEDGLPALRKEEEGPSSNRANILFLFAKKTAPPLPPIKRRRTFAFSPLPMRVRFFESSSCQIVPQAVHGWRAPGKALENSA